MREAIKIWLPLFFIILIAFGVSARFVEPAPKKELTIATGRKGGVYYEYAKRYAQILKSEGVEVHIIETAGSLQTRELLLRHKADIGFIQAGTAKSGDEETINAIAAIYPEPLWIFVRKKSKFQRINDLKGKRIAIGERGSGTFALSEEILKEVGLDQNNTALLDLNASEGCRLLKKKEIDAFFRVVSATSSELRSCLTSPSLRLLPIERIDAFHLRFPYLSGIVLPEGAISLSRNIPTRRLHLLAASAMVVTRKTLDGTLVRLVSKVVKEAQRPSNKLLVTETDYPNLTSVQLPVHPAASRYFREGESWLEKIFPYWIAANIYRLKIMLIPILTLLIPLTKSFLPLYRWRIRSKIYRWYEKLDEVDKQIEKITPSKIDDYITELESLQEEIKRHTDVPLSYMGEYYLLRTHVAFILERLRQKRQKNPTLKNVT